MSEQQPLHLPWAYAYEDGKHGVIASEAEDTFGEFIAIVGAGTRDPEGYTKMIVKAVNMHQELLDAMHGLMEYADPYAVPGCDSNLKAYNKAEEVLAKCK